jgi:hypothetical protein
MGCEEKELYTLITVPNRYIPVSTEMRMKELFAAF